MNKKSERLDSVNEENTLEEIKELLELASEFPSWNIQTCCLYALSNVIINAQEVIITADLPNIDTKTINVDITNQNIIKIKAKLKKQVRFIDLGVYHRKGNFSFLSCKNQVNVSIDIRKKKSSYKDGILEIRFPRKSD
jgi:HSP20 family molecular chaperone IbpA